MQINAKTRRRVMGRQSEPKNGYLRKNFKIKAITRNESPKAPKFHPSRRVVEKASKGRK